MKATKTRKRKRANDSANSSNVEKSPISSTPYVAAVETLTEDEWVDAEDSDSSLTSSQPVPYPTGRSRRLNSSVTSSSSNWKNAKMEEEARPLPGAPPRIPQKG